MVLNEKGRRNPTQGKTDHSLNLADSVKLWPTPRNNSGPSRDDKHLSLDGAVTLWPTPRAGCPGSRPNKKCGRVLSEEVKKNTFPTPTVQDYKQSIFPIVETEDVSAGQLNADWAEILMGYPLFWTDISKEAVFEKNLPEAWFDGTWEEGIPRVITGQKNRVKRLKGLGNAVVPQIPELIFLLIAGALWA